MSTVSGDGPSRDAGECAAIERWQAAENKLYPLALVAPEEYQRALSMVGTVLDRLRDCRTITELVAVEADAIPGPAGGPADGVAVRAALALRAREIRAEREVRRRMEWIEAARARGERWVILEGSRNDLQLGVRFTELHVPTGRALSARYDPYAGDEPFELAELVLSTAGDQQAAREAVFAQCDPWLATLDQWHAEIDRAVARPEPPAA